MAKGTTAMEVRADGVAVITISNPPVNALSFDGTMHPIIPSPHRGPDLSPSPPRAP
ncbi:hypothetical protein GQ55_3G302600 [Panicum hallii var. hallii]|uniref:Uncharacterized protein n=1 Tax=Panicum hallii var. hallii TaxID=1504633 RepID=A0A2T7EEY1_9POAL|nr:hypothetical protein GQ55_3G302600 [Panicum hallii var. hallii]